MVNRKKETYGESKLRVLAAQLWLRSETRRKRSPILEPENERGRRK